MSGRTILIGGWIAFVIYAFPGYMSWDATTQLAQARRNVYTDDHPPIMAVTWHLLEHAVRGPLLMWLLGSVPFVIGMRRLFATRMSDRASALACVLVLWFPPICSVEATIFKDTLMAGFLIAALPLLATRRHVPALLLVCAATAMRYNAVAATLPVVLLLYQFRDWTGWKRYAAASVAWLGVTAGAFAINGVLADEAKHYWYRTHALMDIADTLAKARDYSDDELRAELSGIQLTRADHLQDHLRAIYSPVDFRHLDRGDTQIFVAPDTEAERQAVARVWKRVLSDNLGAYLSYRWDNFVMLMRLDHAVYDNVIGTHALTWHDQAAIVDMDVGTSAAQRGLLAVFHPISKTHLFDPYPYFAIGLVLLWLGRRDRLASAVLLAGLLYQAAWFTLAPTADYRYSEWMIVCVAIGGILVWAARRAKRAASSRPSGSGS